MHSPPRGALSVPHRRRWVVALALGLAWGGLMGIGSGTPMLSWILRTTLVVLSATAAFTLCEHRPARLPGWMARWVGQLVAVVLAIPVAAFVAYCLTTEWPFWRQPQRLQGFAIVTFLGVLVGPWIALAAMVRQRDALARHQALELELTRSELERQALDARMRLLRAQVQPHFLFNTLANVRALVNSGSSHATQVLDSLIAYLRAAVPRLESPSATIDDEVRLVRAYLELMHMRMPDRLQFAVRVDPTAGPQRCPPMLLMTLVENAVRHGIDPSEEGGRIDVDITMRDGRVRVAVTDTGVGMRGHQPGTDTGTGLQALRERLDLAFADRARFELQASPPGGLRAVVEWPGEPAGAHGPAR